jgi:PleD family two-component response regulator
MQELGFRITESQKPLQRVAVIPLGWVLILLGIVGLVLPVVPGAVLIGIGVLMVNPQCVWLRRMLEKCKVRFPVLASAFRRFSAWSESSQNLFKKNSSDSGTQSKFEMVHRGCKQALPERSNMRQRTRQNVDEDETLCGIRNVLIFDEDMEDLARHAEPFEAHGFEVHKCMSVEAAMRSVEREEFEFALVDQGSPAFEGLRIIRHLVRYSPHTPFVVVARRKDLLCCQQALALGATDYLQKPVPSAELNWIIKNYFGSFTNKMS